MSVFVGLDCGGSNTRVMAVDEKGEILFRGLSGPANLASTPRDRLAQHLRTALDGCPQGDFVCGCFAGLINDETRHLGKGLLHDAFPAAAVRAEPDYAAALFAAPEGTEICVVAGTGSLVCSARGEEIVKSGGRGYILGDVGSAFQLGRDALVRFLDAPNSASPAMVHAVKEAFGSTQEETIITGLYASGTPARVVGSLARHLVTAAQDGDEWAIARLRHHMGELAKVVTHHADRHLAGRNSLRIALAGGVWSLSGLTVTLFREALSEPIMDRFELLKLSQPPVSGAVHLARMMAR